MLDLPPSISPLLQRAVPRRPRLPLLCVLLLLLGLAIPLQTTLIAPVRSASVTASITKIDPLTGVRAHGAPISGAGLPLSLRMQPTAAPVTGRSRHVSFRSAALGRTMQYWIYLPPNYRATSQRYPVLYMLHGLYGNDQQWKDMGLFEQADSLIRARQIAPLIIVTPQGDNGYWMNQADDGPRWADYVTHDLLAHIDQTYRTLPDAPHRAIGGLSMGGHGAIQLALNNPGLFSVVGGHSAVFRSQAEAFAFFGTGSAYEQRDPVSLVQHDRVLPFALWLDMGTLDRWLPRTQYFHELLLTRGIVHVWQLNEGDHNDAYWTPRIPQYLAWYDQMLRAGGKVAP